MKSIRNTLILIAAMLFSLPTMAIEMTKEEARDYVKAFVERQKDSFGKSDETLQITFANVEFDENSIKYYFNRNLDEFTPVFPELTEASLVSMPSISLLVRCTMTLSSLRLLRCLSTSGMHSS